MKLLNESFARMQKLAGINEIRVNQPRKKWAKYEDYIPFIKKSTKEGLEYLIDSGEDESEILNWWMETDEYINLADDILEKKGLDVPKAEYGADWEAYDNFTESEDHKASMILAVDFITRYLYENKLITQEQALEKQRQMRQWNSTLNFNKWLSN